MDWFSVGAQVAVGVVFLRAGWLKAVSQDQAQRREAVRSYALLPEMPASILAAVLPWAELVIGVSLILGLWRVASTSAALVLLTGFSAAVAHSVLLGKSHGCGCGDADDVVGWGRVSQNVVLSLALLVAIGSGAGAWRPLVSLDVGPQLVLGTVVAAALVRRLRARVRPRIAEREGLLAHG